MQNFERWTPTHARSRVRLSQTMNISRTHELTTTGWSSEVRIQNDREETFLDRRATGPGTRSGLASRVLIENGAAVSVRDNFGWTPFHTASYSGHLHCTSWITVVVECCVAACSGERAPGTVRYTYAQISMGKKRPNSMTLDYKISYNTVRPTSKGPHIAPYNTCHYTV